MTYIVPFPMVVAGGKVQVQESATPAAVWSHRMFVLLSTRKGERAMRPDYGCDLAGKIFGEESDPEEEVRRAVLRWLPQLIVTGVVKQPLGDGDIRYIVRYTAPSGETSEISVS